MSEQKRPSPEEIDLLLRAAARKRRPWTPGSVLMTVLVFGLPLALIAWWVWPQPAPAHLRVITFDQLAAPGTTVTLRAHLEPADAEAANVSLAGHDLYFEDVGQQRGPGETPWQAQTQSAADGIGTVERTLPADAGFREFAVRYVNSQRRRGAEDRGRIFSWPRDTPLLLVEVDALLNPAEAATWKTANIADLRRSPGVAKALQTAHTKSYQIVYMVVQADQPLLYRKIRDWVQLRPSGNEQRIPDGPVLARPLFQTEMGEADARLQVLRGLKNQFQGPMAAVTGTIPAAEAFRDAGLTTLLMTVDRKTLPGVTSVSGWSEVMGALGKEVK